MKKIILLLLFVSAISAGVPELNELSLEEKIGQLFMPVVVCCPELNLRCFLSGWYDHVNPNAVQTLIKDYHVGGIIFLGLAYKKEVKRLINYFQSISDIPLLVSLDAEFGSGMRLVDGLTFKRAGLLQDKKDEYIYDMAKEIGNELKQLGVHVNFAPVVDVNNNPDNLIIGDRAFSDDPEIVTQKAIAYMQGLHDEGIISCAKHFPGHGDTNVDSHKDLPVIEHGMKRLQEVELYPFTKMIQAGVPMVMMAHLLMPELDEDMPTSLSKKTISFLRNELQFDGVVITDGLNMRALTNNYESGEISLLALLAGNDILLCPNDVPKAVELIKHALQDGRLTEEELDQHVKRILALKRKYFN